MPLSAGLPPIRQYSWWTRRRDRCARCAPAGHRSSRWQDLQATVTWSSSEPQVAEVHPRNGKVRAQAAGTTLLIARSGSESAITSLTVLPPSVASVTIVGARPLKVGDTLVLRAEPKDFRGRALADRSVEWGSSEPAIAPVDSAGVVIAAAPGSTEIRAASEGKAETVRVTVLPQPRTSCSE